MPSILGVIPEHIRVRMSPQDRQVLDAWTMPEIEERQAVRLERELHDQIAGYLRLKGVRVAVHSRMDKRTTTRKGIPDFLFCWERRPVALEAKLPGCDPTEEQIRVMSEMEADGWFVRVVHSIEEVIHQLKEVSCSN